MSVNSKMKGETVADEILATVYRRSMQNVLNFTKDIFESVEFADNEQKERLRQSIEFLERVGKIVLYVAKKKDNPTGIIN